MANSQKETETHSTREVTVVDTDEHDSDRSGEESDEGILVIQPDETSSHNALKRLVDRIFLDSVTFRISSVVYGEIQADQDGVSRRLRSTLFPSTNQVKRRGKRRARSANSGDAEEPATGNKHVQRQSKQKERCENKLMSLLFATVYDHSSKRCRLAGDVPPLKLIKIDKKGQRRSVSNYTEVRAYLRYSMGLVLAAHISAVKVLSEMIPPVFANLPSLFMLLARTFMLILVLESEESGDESGVEQNERDDTTLQKERRKHAYDALDMCIAYIQEYLDEWGDRSYSRKKKLKNCRKAGKNNECYGAIFSLLRAMIALAPPSSSFPFRVAERKRYLYSYGLSHNGQCTRKEEECKMGTFCPRKGVVTDSASQKCHAVIDEIIVSSETATSIAPDLADAELDELEFPTAIWKSTVSEVELHRLTETSHRMRTLRGPHIGGMREEYIAQVNSGVIQCWAAIARSNADVLKMIRTMGSLKKGVLRETVVELVFGGGIAATAVFENDEDICNIAAKLRGRKANSLSEDVGDNHVHESQVSARVGNEVEPNNQPKDDEETTKRADSRSNEGEQEGDEGVTKTGEKVTELEERTEEADEDILDGDDGRALNREGEGDGGSGDQPASASREGAIELSEKENSDNDKSDSGPEQPENRKRKRGNRASVTRKKKAPPELTILDSDSASEEDRRPVTRRKVQKRRNTMTRTVEEAKNQVSPKKGKTPRLRKKGRTEKKKT